MDYYNGGYYDTGYYDTSAVDTANSIMGGVMLTSGVMLLISAAISVLMLVSMWKVFKKCGKPGWACLIPIYNTYIMCEIAGKEWWYLLLFLVPIANIYAMFVIYDGIAKKLGKSTGFTIGLMLLPVIFWPILAFSKNDIVETEMTSAPVQEPITQATSAQPETITQPEGQTYAAPVFGATTAPVQEPIAQATSAQPETITQPEGQTYAAPVFESSVAPVQEPITQATSAQPDTIIQPEGQTYAAPVSGATTTPVQEPITQATSAQPGPVGQSAGQTYVTPTFEPQVETIQEPVEQPVTEQNHTSLWSNNNNNNTQI